MKKIILLASIAFSINALAQVPTNGLVAYYPFTGNANDQSGNANNGSVNGATLTTDRFGNSNSAFYFNGSSNILVNNSSLLQIEDWSLSAWYKTTGPLTGTGRITTKSLVGGTNYLCAMMSADTMNGSAWNGSSQIYTHDNTNTANDIWHHVVYTRNTTTNIYNMYIDNVLKSTVNDAFGNLSNTANLFIGSSHINSQYWFGSLDDIRIYNRAIDSVEVNSLYNEGVCYTNITVTDTLLINTNITGFNPVTYQNTIKVWPNPTHDHITIDNGNIANFTGYQIKITNSLSQQVFQSAINQQQFYVDLSTWTGNGIYFVHIIDGQGNTIDIKKIVLQ